TWLDNRKTLLTAPVGDDALGVPFLARHVLLFIEQTLITTQCMCRGEHRSPVEETSHDNNMVR
ncbi:hypothetical protein, partial [Ruminococcus sp.]|uniref:hypothetical protein n=1 Tax=Ruminococcus sp. TaxID=41978 RepID=UPI003FD83208